MTEVVKPSVENKNENPIRVSNVLYENRYCDQEDFSILVCGGTVRNSGKLNISNDVYELNGPKF